MTTLPNFILYLVVPPLLPILILILPLLYIVRQLVNLYLKVTLKERYGGLLCAGDKTFAIGVNSNPLIMFGCNYIRTDTKVDWLEKFRNYVQKNILDDPDEYLKFNSTLHCFLGEAYLLKEHFKIDEVVKPFLLPENRDEKFNEDYLKKTCSSLYSTPMPRNNTGLFDMFVATEPLQDFDPSAKRYIYPVVYRFHHCVADGARILAISMKYWADEERPLYSDQLNLEEKNKKNKNTISEHVIRFATDAMNIIYLLILGSIAYLNEFILKNRENNLIHPKGFQMSGEKIISWTTELESSHVLTVKSIKNRIPNTKFSDVLLHCVSTAFHDYFKKKNVPPPEKISCLLPLLIFKPSWDGFRPRDLKNEFTFMTVDLPLVDSSDSFTEQLERVKASLEDGKNSILKNFFYLIGNYLSAVIPTSLIQILLDSSAFSSLISNVPGCKKFKVLGEEVISLIITGPNTNQTGLTMTILTLDDKFNICLLADKAVVKTPEDAQFMVDQVLRNIEILDEQSKKVHN